ncbi:hypothetical protein [Nocardioides endophyticus]
MSPAALLISVLALIVATGAGSAYAAAKVTTGQIKNGAVTTPKIANGDVTGAKVANGAVTGAKIQDGAVSAADIAGNAVSGAKILDGAVSAADIAGNAVSGAKILDGSIDTSDLSAATVDALKGTATYWAFVSQAGTVSRGSAGVTSEAQLNGGFWQYRVTFPRDVSQCGYQVSSGDGNAIGSNEYVIPAMIGVARSTQGPAVLAVNLFQWDTGTSIQDTFFIAVTC